MFGRPSVFQVWDIKLFLAERLGRDPGRKSSQLAWDENLNELTVDDACLMLFNDDN